jgi:hypothetical protein
MLSHRLSRTFPTGHPRFGPDMSARLQQFGNGVSQKAGAFVGIYLGRGRPSRSQVFTLELFPGGRQSCAMSTRSSRERIVRNCLTDEGRPLEVGLQERTSNRLSAAVDKSHGRERGRKRPGIDWVRCQARRGLQGNHYGSVETY